MKHYLFIVICFLAGFPVFAQNGYQIKVTLKPFTSGYLYLGHHFGSKQYIIDSAAMNNKGEVVFSGKEKLFGGVYMVIYPGKTDGLKC